MEGGGSSRYLNDDSTQRPRPLSCSRHDTIKKKREIWGEEIFSEALQFLNTYRGGWQRDVYFLYFTDGELRRALNDLSSE